ncbi:MAG: hypothetical protein AAF639_35305 [Chloroflexota bacterium]
MSDIHIRRIRTVLKKEFDGLIDLSDVENRAAQQQEQNFLTRSQAALTIRHIAALTNEAAADTIVDSFDDNGIDAIYFDEDIREVYIVQSKWTEAGNKSPDLGSMEKFIAGFKDILAGRLERFNEKMLAKKDAIERALDSYDVSFVLIIAYTSNQALSEHVERRLNDLLEELNNPEGRTNSCSSERRTGAMTLCE